MVANLTIFPKSFIGPVFWRLGMLGILGTLGILGIFFFGVFRYIFLGIPIVSQCALVPNVLPEKSNFALF